MEEMSEFDSSFKYLVSNSLTLVERNVQVLENVIY